MKCILTGILILLCLCNLKGQNNLPTNIAGQHIKKWKADSAIKRLVDTMAISILFTLKSVWRFEDYYCILSATKSGFWRSYWFQEKIDKPNILIDVPLVQDSLIGLWHLCENAGLLNLPTEKIFERGCDARIFDASHYQFSIVVENKYKDVSYYAPSYYLKECPNSKQTSARKVILSIGEAFSELYRVNNLLYLQPQ